MALTLDNPKKLMVMGVSKDFGRCKGIKKKDGNPCSNIVNRYAVQPHGGIPDRGPGTNYQLQIGHKTITLMKSREFIHAK